MQVIAITLRVKKAQCNMKLIPIAAHEVLRYIEVLWSKTISLCKKLNIIYNTIACNPENYFQWTGSFGQIVLINWFSSLVCLHNCAMVWHICNHSRLLKHIYWCEAWVFYSMCLKQLVQLLKYILVQKNDLSANQTLLRTIWGCGLQVLMLEIMFSFLHRPIILLH